MQTLLLILHVIVCLFLMLTVLLQSGKGGGMGGAFGGSNSGTVFGGSGASTFLRKLTATAAGIFMATSMVLAFIASHDSSDALEKFGSEQAKQAQQKEDAKEKAMLEQGSAGSATGSGASMMLEPTTPPTETPLGTAPAPADQTHPPGTPAVPPPSGATAPPTPGGTMPTKPTGTTPPPASTTSS